MVMTRGRKIYQGVINIILAAVTLSIVLPIMLMFMSSITDENTLVANGYQFFPQKFSLSAYEYILSHSNTVVRAYGITLLVTFIGTTASLALTSMMAFPLSLRELPGRKIISFFVFFTMLFNGGLVPSYIMWTMFFHIRNTLWAYIVPGFLLNAFNVILVRTYFRTVIPFEIYEAAKIDGATYFQIYRLVALPLGKPIMVTIGLFTGLSYYNDWFNGLLYMTDSKLLSIQSLLNKMIQDIQALAAYATADAGAVVNIPQVSIRMAIAFVAIVPILILYPFLQKYFAGGITLGAVKG
jgi:putative aldouronate transport system permease protein